MNSEKAEVEKVGLVALFARQCRYAVLLFHGEKFSDKVLIQPGIQVITKSLEFCRLENPAGALKAAIRRRDYVAKHYAKGGFVA
ncbi:MAG: hypothetical protein ABSF90_12815 [Syntrophobacteraceae bacterium]